MSSAITLIIFGILIWLVLPNFFSGGKKSKDKKQKTMVCKVIGWLLIFLGTYNAISALLDN